MEMLCSPTSNAGAAGEQVTLKACSKMGRAVPRAQTLMVENCVLTT